MAALIALALSLWGAMFAPVITVEFFQNDIGHQAQTAVYAPGFCLIGVNEPAWQGMSPEHRLGLVLHEVGHCLGLDHFGSCNHNISVMGCWQIGELTGYDRAKLAGLQQSTHRAVLPMVGN